MKTAEKLASGWLLILGFMFLTISAASIADKKNANKPVYPPLEGSDREFTRPTPAIDSTAIGGFVFGIPTMTLGGWLALSVYRQGKKDKKALQHQTDERLQTIFYRTIQENNGRVTLLGFAMQSQLPAQEAREFLDSKAKEFNANFRISEEGAISYHFDT